MAGAHRCWSGARPPFHDFPPFRPRSGGPLPRGDQNPDAQIDCIGVTTNPRASAGQNVKFWL